MAGMNSKHLKILFQNATYVTTLLSQSVHLDLCDKIYDETHHKYIYYPWFSHRIRQRISLQSTDPLWYNGVEYVIAWLQNNTNMKYVGGTAIYLIRMS
jgi:hypothetical protein